MKKIILSIIFIFVSNLAFASDCKQRSKNSAFVFFDGKKITLKSGMKIDDPQNKIIVIYNHGGWSQSKNNTEFKYCKGSTVAGVLGKMSGTKVKGKEIVLWMNNELWKAGKTGDGGTEMKCAMKHKFNGKMLGNTPPWYKCRLGPATYMKIKGLESNFAQINRAKVNKAIAETFIKNGTPRNQIFISGQSCGGMGSLRMEALFPEVFNAAIAYMPNCWDRSEHSALRKFQLDEIRSAKNIDALIFQSPVDGETDYQSSSQHLRWMGDIPGVTLTETPGHSDETGKKIIINGVDCKVKKKMKGGWDETHDMNLGHKEKAFTAKDPALKKAIKKKVAGHYLISRSCFEYYIPQITDYIASRL